MKDQKKISYCLWLNGQISEAFDYYKSVFTNISYAGTVYNPVDTPSGTKGSVLAMSFSLEGQEFMLLNGGPEFNINPSISFFVHEDSDKDIEKLFKSLSEGGKVLMPLDKYPFSEKYAWVEDKYGVSWQLMLSQNGWKQKIMPSIMFVNKAYGRAEEAMQYYTNLFPNSQMGNIARYPEGREPDKAGSVMYGEFMLQGQWFACMDSAHNHPFNFSEGVSLVIHCDDQREVDYYWDRLSSAGRTIQCGWLADKYGVCWQVVPKILLEAIHDSDRQKAARVMTVMMKMIKLDVEPLASAARG